MNTTKRFICDLCGQAFSQLHNRKRHQNASCPGNSNRHPLIPLRNMGKSAKSAGYLKQIALKITRSLDAPKKQIFRNTTKSFVCDCRKSYDTFASRRRHQKLSCLNNPNRIIQNPRIDTTTPKVFICDCGNSYSTSVSRKRHREQSCLNNPNRIIRNPRVYQDTPRVFTCEFCGKSLSSKCNRLKHQKICSNNPNKQQRIAANFGEAKQSTNHFKRATLKSRKSLDVPKKTIFQSSGASIFFAQGENVLVFDGTWMYYAKVVSVRSIRNGNIRHLGYRIHYTGWSKDYDVTLKQNRLMKINAEAKTIKSQIEALDTSYDCPPAKNRDKSEVHQNVKSSEHCLGEKVLVYEEGQLYTARIIEVGEGELISYKVHYFGWNKSRDEWISGNRILKRTSTAMIIKNKLKECKEEGKVFDQELTADEIRTTDFYSYSCTDKSLTHLKDPNQPCNYYTPSLVGDTIYKYPVHEKRILGSQTEIALQTVIPQIPCKYNLSLKVADANNNSVLTDNTAREADNSTKGWQNERKVPTQDFHSWMKKWFPIWTPTESEYNFSDYF